MITTELKIENENLARQALEAWRNGTAGYSDYLLLLANQAAGCELTYSFDLQLAKHPLAATPP